MQIFEVFDFCLSFLVPFVSFDLVVEANESTDGFVKRPIYGRNRRILTDVIYGRSDEKTG